MKRSLSAPCGVPGDPLTFTKTHCPDCDDVIYEFSDGAASVTCPPGQFIHFENLEVSVSAQLEKRATEQHKSLLFRTKRRCTRSSRATLQRTSSR